MVRDQERFKQSLEDHHRWQLDYFNTLKNNLIIKAEWWENPKNPKHNPKKGATLRKEAAKMRFQFDKKEAVINFGNCSKLNKPVTFIPNTCQLDTQDCFEHRRE